MSCAASWPVMKYDPDSREWVESGEYVFDSKGALKAMELLGKPLGMFEQDGDEIQGGVTIVDDV